MIQMARRYEVLDDDERFGLKQGDVIVGVPYAHDPGHRRNPDGKIAVLWREGDDYRPGCNQYWYNLLRLSGRVPIEWDSALKDWRRPHAWKRPLPRAKRNRHARTSSRAR